MFTRVCLFPCKVQGCEITKYQHTLMSPLMNNKISFRGVAFTTFLAFEPPRHSVFWTMLRNLSMSWYYLTFRTCMLLKPCSHSVSSLTDRALEFSRITLARRVSIRSLSLPFVSIIVPLKVRKKLTITFLSSPRCCRFQIPQN